MLTLKFKRLLQRAFSLAEVLWGVFLLATAIVVIAGVLISSLQAMRKSDLMLRGTNILVAEQGKFEHAGYKGTPSSLPVNDNYMVERFYVMYSIDYYDFNTGGGPVTNELKVLTLGVYNVPPATITSTPRDRLVALKATSLLVYSP